MAPRLSLAIEEKRFAGGEPLFSNFRLEVEPGSVLAVLGPSGIGKSSLLRIMAGIDRAFSGAVRIDGKELAQAPMPGFVFQDARLLPWLTVLDNLRLADPGLTGADGEALLAQVGLAGSAGAFPGQLSGGMQRRVALARALAANGQWLLVDEPFVSLDAALAGEMRALLARLIEAHGASAVLVTHEVEDAARLADRVVVLAGRPAAIVADLALPVPRKERQGEALDRLRRQIGELLGPGAGA